MKKCLSDVIFTSDSHFIYSSGSLGLVGMTKLVFQEEGLSGFYGGVVGVMIGQGYQLSFLRKLSN